MDRVQIAGLIRTKDDYIQHAVRNLFKTTNFADVLVEVNQSHDKLSQLGVFSGVRCRIDVSKGETATPNGLDVCESIIVSY